MPTKRFTADEIAEADTREVSSRGWRHGRFVTYVFEHDGAQWRFEIAVHHENGWELDGDVEATQVHQVDRTVKVWENVP